MKYSFRYGLVLWIAGAYLGLGLMGCQPSSPSQSTTASTFVPPDTLYPVTIPDLEDFAPSVRTQINTQFAHLQSLQDSSDVEARGEAAGVLGRLLLSYALTDAAKASLLNAIYLLPEDYRWPYYLGYLFSENQQLQEAAQAYEQVLALQPDYVPAHVNLAAIYRNLNRDEEAKPLLERAIELDPACAPAHFLLGQIASEASEAAQAIEHYQTVLELQPTATIVYTPLGLALQQQGDQERSETYLAQSGNGQVLLDDPLIREMKQEQKGVGVKLSHGSILMETGRFREAAIFFSQAIKEDSTDIIGYLNLGAALMQLGQWNRAQPVLERAIRIEPTNSQANYNLGLILAQQQRPEAKTYFQAAVQHDPTNSKAQLGLARMLWREGDCAAAVPHFDAYLQAQPGAAEIRVNAAMCQVRVGNEAAALALLEAGHKAQPTHPGLLDALVRVLSASRDDSVRDGGRAVELGQNLVATLRRPETLASLAMAMAEADRFTEAIERQQEALRMARQGGLTDFVPVLQRDLQRYQQKQPSRTPWPDSVFPKPAS